MVIHVVRPGESADSIALAYGIPMSQLVLDNGLESSGRLTAKKRDGSAPPRRL